MKFTQLEYKSSIDGEETMAFSAPSQTVSITANTISALASDNSFNDSGSGFVSAGFAVGDQIGITGFTGNSANNIFSATITSLTSSKMVIGGGDGDVIVDDSAGESVTIFKWESVRSKINNLSQLYIKPDGTSSYEFGLKGRSVSGIAVPYLTPVSDNTPIALDIFPNGSPGNFLANAGVAYIDICSTDIESDGTNYEACRLGVFSSGDAHLSHAKGGTGTVRNLRLQINGGNVGIGANTSPTYKLTIDGDTIPCVAIRDDGADKFFFGQATASGNWFTNASDGDHCIRGMGGAILMGSNATTPGYTFGMTSAGAIYNPTHGTTASAANMFINSSTGLISRSTSVRRLKTDIAPIRDSSIVYGLEPVTYRSLCQADDPDAVMLGLIAEDVAAVVPELASYDADGRPNGVQYERLAVLLLAELKILNERVRKLEEIRCVR